MATTDKAGIQATTAANIRTGASDTTAAELRALIYEILDSYVNVKDGGHLYEKEVGYSYLPTLLDPHSFINKAYADENYKLGLIQIVDLDGDFFTDLTTAKAYIRTYIDETNYPITDESFNQGVYYFTVPQNTECILASNFLGDDSNTISAYIIDKLGLITKYTTKCFQKNSGNNYLGDCEFDIPSGSSSDSPFFYAIGQSSIGSFILNSTVWFGHFSTGYFIFRGNIGTSESTLYIMSSTAYFSVQQNKYTSNAGGIHASLVNNPKVFFGGIDKVEKNIIVSSSITADLDTNYTMNATSTFTDPSPVEAKGYTVFVINGTATVGGVAYSVVGTIIKRFYHSGSWISNIYIDKDQHRIPLFFQHGSVNLADSTSYFICSLLAAPNTITSIARRISAPLTGMLREVEYHSLAGGIASSSQDISVVVNNVTQGTSVTVGNIRYNNLVGSYYFSGLTFSVNKNDDLEIKLIVPVLTTNPTACLCSGNLFFS